jgi:hypothetical protein
MLSNQEIELINTDDVYSPVFINWVEKCLGEKISVSPWRRKKSENWGYESSKARLKRLISEIGAIASIQNDELASHQKLLDAADKITDNMLFRLADVLDFWCWRLIRCWVVGIEIKSSTIKLWKAENPLMSGRSFWERLLLIFMPENCTALHRIGTPLKITIDNYSPCWSGAFLQVEKSQGQLTIGFSCYLIAGWLVFRGNIFNQQQGSDRMIDFINSHGCLTISAFAKEWQWNYGDWLLGKPQFDIAPLHSFEQTIIVNNAPVYCSISIAACSQYREKLRFWEKYFLRTTVTFPIGLPSQYGNMGIDSITLYDALPFKSQGSLDWRITQELETRASC